MSQWDFPGSPGAKTPSSQCRGPGFNPGGGLDPTCHNKDLTCHNEDPAWLNKFKKKKKDFHDYKLMFTQFLYLLHI